MHSINIIIVALGLLSSGYAYSFCGQPGADNPSNLNEPSNIHEKMCFETLQFAKAEKNLEVNLNDTFYCGTYRQFINLFASKKYTVKEGLRQIQYSPFLIHGTSRSNFKHILDSIEI